MILNTLDMKKTSITLIISILFFMMSLSTVHSQKYLDMMEDNAYNVYDVIKEAENYFQFHQEKRGGIWKAYNRWRAANEPFFYPSGDRSSFDPVALRSEIDQFNNAQYSKQNGVKTTQWSELGPYSSTYNGTTGSPAPGVGMINKVWVNTNDTNHIRCGSIRGGLWETFNGGTNWVIRTEGLISPKANVFAVYPGNSDIIYMPIEDGRGFTSDLLKSTDGGITWLSLAPTGGIEAGRIKHIVPHPTNASIVYAATNSGIYKSSNGGSAWIRFNTPNNRNFDNLLMKPDDPETLYFACYDGQEPRRYLFKTIDGGLNWTQHLVLPVSSNGRYKRAKLSVTAANPDYVYFTTNDHGVWKSTNAGITFTKISEVPGTYMSQGVSDIDPDIFLYGTPNLFIWDKSTNAFKQVTKYNDGLKPGPYQNAYVHADIRGITSVNGVFYIGTDGYLAKSSDNGVTWQRISNGIAVREIGGITWSSKNSTRMVTGSHDNGLSILKGSVWFDYAVGDGIKAHFDHQDINTIYGVTALGFCYKTTDGGASLNWSFTQPGANNATWITPFAMHPTDGKTLYIGFDEVKKTTDGMISWTTVSSFGSLNTYDKVTELAVAPSNGRIIFAAKNNRLWKSFNAGGSWTQINSGLPNAVISNIAIHPSDPNKVALSYFGTSAGNKVYFSADGGRNWTNYSGSLPNTDVNYVAFEDNPNDIMYITVDQGVYYRSNSNTSWTLYSDGLPATRLLELAINESTKKIRVATFGRGLWEASLVSESLSTTEVSNAPKKAKLIPYFNLDNNLAIVFKNIESGFYNMTILNVNGQILKRQNLNVSSSPNQTETIQMSSVAKGFYFVRIHNESNSYIAKCIR